MLYLVRKLGESIIINGDIEVKVVEVKGKTVKLGLDFPSSATVLRKEIHERIVAENKTAHTSDIGADDFSDALSGFASFNLDKEKLTLKKD